MRNRWAHQEIFSSDDAYRALDSVERLLSAVSVPESDEVDRMKMELLRLHFDEQARGKMHSKLALYHLFSGIAPTELAGIDAVMAAAGAGRISTARRVVLVGNKISPGNPSVQPDGTVVRTLWGELAWQLGGSPAFARVRTFERD